jgi:hypothetical protein
MFRKVLFMLTVFTMILGLSPVYGEIDAESCDPEELFRACDVNKDGRITKEEWDALDVNKDQMITNDEWDKYRYKSTEKKSSPFHIRYYDVYGDEGMGKEEFLKNYQRLR